MLRFAVVGNPVSHSKSPLIHSLFAQQLGVELQYTREEVAPGDFDSFVTGFFADGGSGLNVTVPFKEQAFLLSQSHSPRAALARAVNTLLVDEAEQLAGDNTDGVGLVRDIRDNNEIQIKDKRILVVGAGGAVRGALGSLLEEVPQSITLVNRTLARAIALQEEFAKKLPQSSVQINTVSFDQSLDGPFDLVINGTSTGLHGQVPPLSSAAIGPASCCYDMVYGNRETAFMKWAIAHGAARSLDGLGMLVEQAAESFSIWLKQRPETGSVISRVRSSLKSL